MVALGQGQGGAEVAGRAAQLATQQADAAQHRQTVGLTPRLSGGAGEGGGPLEACGGPRVLGAIAGHAAEVRDRLRPVVACP